MKQSGLIKSIIGEEVYESLTKALVKLNTASVVDIDELHAAMKTAPKSIVAFLMKQVKDMKKGDAKEVDLPWDDNCHMLLNKIDEDVYKGHIVRDSKIIHNFDLTAIPQLAAHILSTLELYEEAMAEDKAEHQPQPQSNPIMNDSSMKDELKSLENKINALMMLVISQSSSKKEEPKDPSKVWMDKKDFLKEHKKLDSVLRSPSHKDDIEEADEQEKEVKEQMNKSEVKKNLQKFDSFLKSMKSLCKGGIMPTMPKPPQPGKRSGGTKGITQGGLHGDKTEHSDLNAKPITQLKNPDLKTPKGSTLPKQPKAAFKSEAVEKTLTLSKAEMSASCPDCGQKIGNASCACFRALSSPEVIKKSDSSNVTFKFKNDWDNDSLTALYRSIKRHKNEQ